MRVSVCVHFHGIQSSFHYGIINQGNDCLQKYKNISSLNVILWHSMKKCHLYPQQHCYSTAIDGLCVRTCGNMLTSNKRLCIHLWGTKTEVQKMNRSCRKRSITQTHNAHAGAYGVCVGPRVLCCVRVGACSCTWPPSPGWICLSFAASSSPYRMSGITCRKGFLNFPPCAIR